MSELHECPDCGFPLTLMETGRVRLALRLDSAQVAFLCIDVDCAGNLREVSPLVRRTSEASV